MSKMHPAHRLLDKGPYTGCPRERYWWTAERKGKRRPAYHRGPHCHFRHVRPEADDEGAVKTVAVLWRTVAPGGALMNRMNG